MAVLGASPPSSGTPQTWVNAVRTAAPKPASGACLDVRYEGVVDLEGHLRRPGQTLRYRSTRRFVSNGRGAIRMDWTTWMEGDSLQQPESFLLTNGTVYHRTDPTKPWEIFTRDRADRAILQLRSGLPWEFLGSNLPRGTSSVELPQSDGVDQHRISIPPVGVRHPSMTIGGKQLVSYEELWPHPRLGDVQDYVRYTYGTSPFPDSIKLGLNEWGSRWTLTEGRVAAVTNAGDESLLVRPAAAEVATADHDSMVGEPEIVSIAPGVWSADMTDLDSRSLVVEFKEYLVVIECADESKNGERLVDALKKKFPDKPIRYALFSHYHPHYTGGLRALSTAGATIVTTTGNEKFVEDMGTLSFGLQPDRMQKSGSTKMNLQTFIDRIEIADSTQRIVLLDIGDRSDHTDEFVVFWLPNSRIVFEAEQGWLTVNGALKATRRAEKFMRTMDEMKVQYDRIVQSWPMRGTARDLTKDQLAELVRKRKSS